jgi:biotin synthase
MSPEEIVDNAEYAVGELNFKALVLQSGEDLWFGEKKLIDIVSRLMKKSPALLIISIGERDTGFYKRLYAAGARAVLLRFETSNTSLYEKYRPSHKLKDRLGLIRGLKEIGYLVFTGFLIGLPGETEKDISESIKLTDSLGPEMFSFGPFIPHPDTPLGNSPGPDLNLALDTIAKARIMYPDSRILATTSLETLDKENGAKNALLAGANSLMIDVTYPEYRGFYQIYPDRAGIDMPIKDRIGSVIKLLHSIGRVPADLGM